MQKGIKVLGFLVAVLFIVGFGIACTDDSSNEPEKVGEESEGKTQEAKTYKIGDKVKLGDNVITVKGVSGYTSSNQFLQPESGNKFVAVDIVHKNSGDDPTDYNMFDFQLQDNKGYTYQPASTDKEPRFGSGTLQKGRQVRGFLTFEIPKKNKVKELIFTPSFWGTDQIIIKLTE